MQVFSVLSCHGCHNYAIILAALHLMMVMQTQLDAIVCARQAGVLQLSLTGVQLRWS